MRAPDPVESFIARWNGTEQAERANYALFLSELCTIIGVEPPDPASGPLGPYRFERSVDRHEPDGSVSKRRIDLYRRGCFVLEAKQGANPRQPELFAAPEKERRGQIRRTPGWVQAMMAARGQAERYARDLPTEEGWPPFLIVCDVGFCFDLYADFTGKGKHYAHFPDRESYRIYLPDLKRQEVRERLRAIWQNPLALDPSLRRTRVTQDIAQFLAKLARALEQRHPADQVATFLMRCIFCMFAQSVGLLPADRPFTKLLRECQAEPRKFVSLVGDLWRAMNPAASAACCMRMCAASTAASTRPACTARWSRSRSMPA